MGVDLEILNTKNELFILLSNYIEMSKRKELSEKQLSSLETIKSASYWITALNELRVDYGKAHFNLQSDKNRLLIENKKLREENERLKKGL